jgi:hypothetical protein
MAVVFDKGLTESIKKQDNTCLFTVQANWTHLDIFLEDETVSRPLVPLLLKVAPRMF